MGRPKSVLPKTRLTIELSDPVRARLEDLRGRTGAESLTEVIRRALAYYDVIIESSTRGEVYLLVRDEHGRQQTVLIPRPIV